MHTFLVGLLILTACGGNGGSSSANNNVENTDNFKAELKIYCSDGKTGNVWQVNDGDECVFTDPTQGTDPPYTHSIQIAFNDGTSDSCKIEIYKNSTMVYQSSYTCNSLNHSYILDNADTGRGRQRLDFKVYKNSTLIDTKALYYKINKAPTFGG